MCTVFMYQDANGVTYQARSHEDPIFFAESVTYYPAGSSIESMTPAGKPGKTFNTKYAFLAVTLAGMLPLNVKPKQESVLEGSNDQGLCFTGNNLFGTTSIEVSSSDDKVLVSTDLGHWALGNFQNVAQVKQALANKEVDIWVPALAAFGNLPSPVHYALFDKTGGAIVIEFTNGQVQIYDNPVGVMTNGPEFPWHLVNLNNYAQLTNVDTNSSKFNKLKVSPVDSGNALANLPSDQTSVGRFVKAAFYSNYAKKASTPKEAVLTLAHVVNNFDRPRNISIDLPDPSTANVENNATDKTQASSEVTLISFVNDLAQNQWYIRTINAMNFTKFDIPKLASLKQLKVITLDSIDELDGGDGTHLFLN